MSWCTVSRPRGRRPSFVILFLSDHLPLPTILSDPHPPSYQIRIRFSHRSPIPLNLRTSQRLLQQLHWDGSATSARPTFARTVGALAVTMPNVFAVPIFFIVFRETIETGIVISVLLSFLKQQLGPDHDATVYKKLRKQVRPSSMRRQRVPRSAKLTVPEGMVWHTGWPRCLHCHRLRTHWCLLRSPEG